MKEPNSLQELFYQMAENLDICRRKGQIFISPPPTMRLIACPLCLRLFTIGDLENRILTPEHVPPKALGGTIETLTCNSCNHQQGASLEGPLANRLRYEEFGMLKLNASAESTILLKGHPINSYVSLQGENQFNFKFDPKKSHPEHEKIIGKLEKGERTGEIKIIPKKKFKDRSATLGVLRIAYLKAFLSLGYEYICTSNMEPIRNQLKSPSLEMLPDFGVIDKNVPEKIPNLGVVVNPASLRSLFICVELKSDLGTRFRFGVLLPLPTKDGFGIYHLLAKFKSDNEWPNLKIQPIEINQ